MCRSFYVVGSDELQTCVLFQLLVGFLGYNVYFCTNFRPLNQDEKQLVSPAVISCNEKKGIVTLFQNTAHKQIDKNYQFDKVSLCAIVN